MTTHQAIPVYYRCGYPRIRFVLPLVAESGNAQHAAGNCPLCEASHTYRDAMAYRELAERATREVLATREQELEARHG